MDIESIAAVAAQVGTEYEESQAAIVEREKAEAELLAAVVEKVRPALRAIASRIQAGWRMWYVDSVSTADEKEWRTEHGLCVAGDDGPEHDYPRANTGAYEGTGLWLLDDGTFARVTYEGNWSRWQGSGSHWTATLEAVPLERVVKEYSVDEIVEAISTALAAQAGTRGKRVQAAKERAEKVRAIASLLGGGK